MAQSNQVLNQNLKDLENFPKIYKSLEIKMKEKCENLKGINADIQETEINVINGKNKIKLDFFGIFFRDCFVFFEETNLLSSENLTMESLRIKTLTLEFEIQQKSHGLNFLVKSIIFFVLVFQNFALQTVSLRCKRTRRESRND
jgi:hypothetical protein